MLRVVTIDVGHGPCPIPYPRKSTSRVQSCVPGSNSKSRSEINIHN
jgi:hypothetical protein